MMMMIQLYKNVLVVCCGNAFMTPSPGTKATSESLFRYSSDLLILLLFPSSLYFPHYPHSILSPPPSSIRSPSSNPRL